MTKAIDKLNMRNKQQRRRRRPTKAHTPFPSNTIRPVKSETKQIFLDRLEKEIIVKYGWSSLNGRCGSRGDKRYKKQTQNLPISTESVGVCDDTETLVMKRRRNVVKKRFFVGVNQCTRVLEKMFNRQSQTSEEPEKEKELSQSTVKNLKPRLLVLCKDSLSMLGHIPLLAEKAATPIIVLSGKNASMDLGKVCGYKRVSICLFVENRDKQYANQLNDKGLMNTDLIEQKCHTAINSFVEYIISLI